MGDNNNMFWIRYMIFIGLFPSRLFCLIISMTTVFLKHMCHINDSRHVCFSILLLLCFFLFYVVTEKIGSNQKSTRNTIFNRKDYYMNMERLSDVGTIWKNYHETIFGVFFIVYSIYLIIV